MMCTHFHVKAGIHREILGSRFRGNDGEHVANIIPGILHDVPIGDLLLVRPFGSDHVLGSFFGQHGQNGLLVRICCTK